MSTNIIFSAFPPYNTFNIALPNDTLVADISTHVASRIPGAENLQYSLVSGVPLPVVDTCISALASGSSYVRLRVTPRILGGKGGFGSQLRAAGGRMSSQKTDNKDSCRDLSGRRLSTIKEAKKMAEYLESEPLRQKAAKEAQKAKLEKLERELGGTPGNAESSKLEDTSVVAGKKHRFDDIEYLKQSEEIVDSVKSAVVAGLLKKRKKAKVSNEEKATEAVTASTSSSDGPLAEVTQAVLESPVTAPVAAAAAVAAGVAASA
ncbi:hypothetical protein DACRYDRAFT_93191 [Dacryopinax primogenitus]|uniref:Uncharacterized protein n=1 Tax=Dacryopinax primogenitus (strain DJM 731) TaxID=1858805 RepID=M5GG26_DACPD|nr:uncharacterized protein DACRYDRAFT_93191 [Dacryopinax primogenitus]EJU04753.1 hypothetical protein DACRYDRAFT_93191 [Dacryopinax primogenitus]